MVKKIFDRTFLRSKKGQKSTETYYIKGLDELRQKLTAITMTPKWTPMVFLYKKDKEIMKKINSGIIETRNLVIELLKRIEKSK